MSLVENTVHFVKEQLKNAEAGHDWFHIERVVTNAKKIAESEDCREDVVEIAALLHDIADPKFHDGNETLAQEVALDFLQSQNADSELILHVLHIIKNVSFKNKEEQTGEPSVELQIVQDADRLDALGAIGIARAFHFGGFKNNVIYDASVPPVKIFDKEKYKKSNGTTINHFYEKLLLLKEGMQTKKGREMAEKRHQFMVDFLEQFYEEVQ